ncbi:MAG: hypothetical protein ABJA74_11060 [Lapillicoccus sp.]
MRMGMALLAAYLRDREGYTLLNEYLGQRVFVDQPFDTVTPDPSDAKGFDSFMTRYRAGLALERLAASVS